MKEEQKGEEGKKTVVSGVDNNNENTILLQYKYNTITIQLNGANLA